MGKKKLKIDGIYFIGENAEDVTGSCIYIIFNGKKILLENGMWQSNDYLESYNVNSRNFKFNPKEIDYVFLNHIHIDHSGLLPRLVDKGFTGKIITSYETSELLEDMLKNCSWILDSEARILSKNYEREYEPLYTVESVDNMLNYVYPYDKDKYIYKLDDVVSFQWFPNSHCLGAKQLQLILTDELGVKHKILYTSDFGGFKSNNHYMNNTEICQDFNEIAIMESTYGQSDRINKKTREFDIEKLKSAIITTLERGGTLMLPCFSFSRSQEILTTIYELFHDDDNFYYDIVVDSMLTCQISEKYSKLLHGDDLILWSNVIQWDNVTFCSDKADSDGWIKNERPKIVLSSSGFCNNGRIIKYLQNYLGDDKNMLVMTGYCGADPSYLSYRIKNYKDFPKLKINKVMVDNKADVITLGSFSSHANREDLIKMGSSLNTNKLILVHGSKKAKEDLKKSLVEEISKKDKSYRVIACQKDMVIPL